MQPYDMCMAIDRFISGLHESKMPQQVELFICWASRVWVSSSYNSNTYMETSVNLIICYFHFLILSRYAFLILCLLISVPSSTTSIKEIYRTLFSFGHNNCSYRFCCCHIGQRYHMCPLLSLACQYAIYLHSSNLYLIKRLSMLLFKVCNI